MAGSSPTRRCLQTPCWVLRPGDACPAAPWPLAAPPLPCQPFRDTSLPLENSWGFPHRSWAPHRLQYSVADPKTPPLALLNHNRSLRRGSATTVLGTVQTASTESAPGPPELTSTKQKGETANTFLFGGKTLQGIASRKAAFVPSQDARVTHAAFVDQALLPQRPVSQWHHHHFENRWKVTVLDALQTRGGSWGQASSLSAMGGLSAWSGL